jgi:hypothetical protein
MCQMSHDVEASKLLKMLQNVTDGYRWCQPYQELKNL